MSDPAPLVAEKDKIKVSPAFYRDSPLTFVSRQKFGHMLGRIKLLEQALEVHGHIVECGVYRGSIFMSLYNACTLLEPYGLNRKIIGFDTFSGFPELSPQDGSFAKKGDVDAGENTKELLEHLIDEDARFRPGGHVPKTELIAGDAVETIPQYVKDNPDLIIAMLILDFDIYEPLLVALQCLLPLVVKGGVVAFDDINAPRYPGAARAFLAHLGPDSVQLKRFAFDPFLSYWIK